MADDILDELEDDFNDELSDVLEEDEAEDEESEEADENKKKSLISKVLTPFKLIMQKVFGSTKAIIITAVSFVLMISVAVVFWLFVFKESQEDLLKPQQAELIVVDSASIEQEREIIFEDIVELEPFERIKLKTSSTMGRVSLHVALELTDARYRKQIYSMEDRIRTIVTQQVGNTTWLELRNPDGKIMLKYNMLQRVNAIFPEVTVRNIYFTFFIMQ